MFPSPQSVTYPLYLTKSITTFFVYNIKILKYFKKSGQKKINLQLTSKNKKID